MIQDPWAEADRHPGLKRYSAGGMKAIQEYTVAPVTTQDPRQAFRSVLAGAGCFPRDAVSLRTVSEVRAGEGKWGRFEPPGGLMEGLTAGVPPEDLDHDGMADEWERANGLNPEDSNDFNRVMASGYTAIEQYCNMLAVKLLEDVEN